MNGAPLHLLRQLAVSHRAELLHALRLAKQHFRSDHPSVQALKLQLDAAEDALAYLDQQSLQVAA